MAAGQSASAVNTIAYVIEILNSYNTEIQSQLKTDWTPEKDWQMY